MTIRSALRVGTAAVLIAALAGCTSVFPGRGPPPALYDLSPKSTYDPDVPAVTAQLVVEVPVAADSLNTTRIAVRRRPLSIDYYQGVRWTERAPVLVQTLLVESFENSQRIVAVARQSIDLRADYVLKTELREFQAEYIGEAAPSVRVRLNAKLVRMPARIIVASRTFERRIAAPGRHIEKVVRAFDEALGKVLKATVEWTLRTMAALPPAPRAAGATIDSGGS